MFDPAALAGDDWRALDRAAKGFAPAAATFARLREQNLVDDFGRVTSIGLRALRHLTEADQSADLFSEPA